MRSPTRQRRAEEEDESVFVSMTDLTVSFLFVLMVLVAFLATQTEKQEMVPRSDLSVAEAARDAALREITSLQRLLSEAEASLAAARALTGKLEAERDGLRLSLQRLDARLQHELRTNVVLAGELAAARQRIEDLLALLAAARDRAAKLDYDLLLALDVLGFRSREVAALRDALARAKARDQDVRDRLADRLQAIADTLNTRFPDAKVLALRDVLRFQGEGLFARRRSDLAPEKQAVVELLAEQVQDLLRCMSRIDDPVAQTACGIYEPVVETVLIEGHTDTTGVEEGNLTLSTQRALFTLRTMTGHRPDLRAMRNATGQTLLAVAGYGWQRPVIDTGPNADEPRNRRIDLRFILALTGSAP